MAKIYRSVEELIGKTPLLELTRYEQEHGLQAKILVKLEAVSYTHLDVYKRQRHLGQHECQ